MTAQQQESSPPAGAEGQLHILPRIGCLVFASNDTVRDSMFNKKLTENAGFHNSCVPVDSSACDDQRRKPFVISLCCDFDRLSLVRPEQEVSGWLILWWWCLNVYKTHDFTNLI